MVTNTIKKASIGWLVNQVVHGFVKGDVLSCLNSLGDGVIKEDVLHCFGEAKGDTDTRIGFNLGSMADMGRKSIDMTTKDMEQVKIRLLTSAQFIGRGRMITVNSDIV